MISKGVGTGSDQKILSRTGTVTATAYPNVTLT